MLQLGRKPELQLFSIAAMRFSRAAVLVLTSALAGTAAAENARLPGDFVFLSDIDASIHQDIRYASPNNFIGHPLPGYVGAECVLRRGAAEALSAVQRDLAPRGLSLKVYDCYRPERAVRAMADWANDGKSSDATKRFFPQLDKGRLFAQGYIAARSMHSLGIAVDLTLIELAGEPAAAFDPNARYGACTGPAAARAPDDSVDMGTGFDCFDPKAHTASPAITAEQRRWRSTLLDAMGRRGFANYAREWWHFTYGSGAGNAFDFPIPAQ
jgi:D-alanyl-D-alanine dipeptidase